MIKCVECGRPFKEDENVVITDGDMYDPVHEQCHYNYLLNNRPKDTLPLNEYKEQLNDMRKEPDLMIKRALENNKKRIKDIDKRYF